MFSPFTRSRIINNCQPGRYYATKKFTKQSVKTTKPIQAKTLSDIIEDNKKNQNALKNVSTMPNKSLFETESKKRSRTIEDTVGIYQKNPYSTLVKREQQLQEAGVPADVHQKERRRLSSSLRKQQWIENSKNPKPKELSHRAKERSTPVDPVILAWVKKIYAGKVTKNKKFIQAQIDSRRGAPPYIDAIFRKDKLKKIASAKNLSTIPEPIPCQSSTESMKYIPEFAFAGRSNVGKSTLLNTLVGSLGKAAVSSKPGMTQTLNFYRLSNYFCFVDLPGYGFAYAKEKKIDNWNELIRWYLVNRQKAVLKRVFVLIDARHGLKEPDREFLKFLNLNNVKNQIILTKSDTVYPDDLARRIKIINDEISTARSTIPDVLLISGKTHSGILEVQKAMCSLMPKQNIIKHEEKIELSRMNPRPEKIPLL
ncbi:GTP-binding protein EngB [Acrasis kona]|uniref:GTP-binding protein EngB n=1 Tax=Acrasis kona TaxID=1008807 RepID=A0AAW2Z055_9EUKA